jgi:CRISPR-associated endonuclease/helicase Cas3
VYDDLRVIEATWRQIEAKPMWRIPAMNRELVELATHPEALRAIVAELGAAWRRHGEATLGGVLCDAQQARAACVRFTLGFDSRAVAFRDGEVLGKIKTRLGADDLAAVFTDSPCGPFGAAVKTLRVPAWMVRCRVADALVAPVDVDVTGRRLQFRFAETSFVYDNYGLRQYSPAPGTAVDDG